MSDPSSEVVTNGSGAATILSAAIGCLTLGGLALLGDVFSNVSALLNLWKPTGALSGVTDAAILVWLVTWLALSKRWERRSVDMARVNWASLAMFFIATLLTFPPFMDLLQGK